MRLVESVADFFCNGSTLDFKGLPTDADSETELLYIIYMSHDGRARLGFCTTTCSSMKQRMQPCGWSGEHISFGYSTIALNDSAGVQGSTGWKVQPEPCQVRKRARAKRFSSTYFQAECQCSISSEGVFEFRVPYYSLY
jgi:hypothetical protein